MDYTICTPTITLLKTIPQIRSNWCLTKFGVEGLMNAFLTGADGMDEIEQLNMK
jgi:hypothetical protein